MIKTRREQSHNRPRVYFARCDCTGLTGRWSCENCAREGKDRQAAALQARNSGWVSQGAKWYCPECQRDGLVPSSNAKPQPMIYELLR